MTGMRGSEFSRPVVYTKETLMKISSGINFLGQEVSKNKFQVVSTIGQLKHAGLLRPSVKVKSSEDGQYSELRATMNRRFDKARCLRAEGYAKYIRDTELLGVRDGGTPAITLWCDEEVESLGDGVLAISYSAHLVAVDGETQLEARYIIAEEHPAFMNHPIAVTIYAGMSQRFGQQILADYNSYAVPVNAGTAANFNHASVMGRALEEVKARNNWADSAIKLVGGPKPRKEHFASALQLRAFIAGFDGELKRTNSPVTATKRINAGGIDISKQDLDRIADELRSMVYLDCPARVAPVIVWYMAGHACKEGRRAAQMNFERAYQAYIDVKKDKSMSEQSRILVGVAAL